MKKTQDLLPYERFLQIGPQSLSDKELLALVIRSGVKGTDVLNIAEQVTELLKGKSIYGLYDISYKELLKIRGIGTVKAVKILCIIEFARRLYKPVTKSEIKFLTPEQLAGHYMEDLCHLKKEHVMLVLMNAKNVLLGDRLLTVGTVNSSLVSTREVMVEALKENAVNIAIIHNHPSGDPTPSREDILITRKVKEAAALLDIELIDHIIIGNRKYTSLKDKALM